MTICCCPSVLLKSFSILYNFIHLYQSCGFSAIFGVPLSGHQKGPTNQSCWICQASRFVWQNCASVVLVCSCPCVLLKMQHNTKCFGQMRKTVTTAFASLPNLQKNPVFCHGGQVNKYIKCKWLSLSWLRFYFSYSSSSSSSSSLLRFSMISFPRATLHQKPAMIESYWAISSSSKSG